jgi:hypothetical protein
MASDSGTHDLKLRSKPLPGAAKVAHPKIEQLSDWLDSRFTIRGTNIRFGLDALLGLIPGLGDAVTAIVSLYIISLATRHQLPKFTMARMAVNVLIDFLVGIVPVVGDLFDVAWKANTRNVELLRHSMAENPQRARKARMSDWLFVVGLTLLLLLALVGAVFLAWSLVAAFVYVVER